MIKKILKSNFVINLLSYVFIAYLWITLRSCRKQFIWDEESKKIFYSHSPGIFICWHSRFSMYLTITTFGGFHAITSAHKDGNFLENILRFFGHKPIRGSSRKKAFSAAKSVLALDPTTIRLVITPDGPLGPRYKVKGLVLRISKKLGIPIVPLTFTASHAIVLKTWDRFIVPIPFLSKLVFHIHKPIYADSAISAEILSDIMYKQMVDLDKSVNLKVDY